MQAPVKSISLLLTALASLFLIACSSQEPTSGQTSEPAAVVAPAGLYRIDPTHADVAFSVKHLGLSNYIARFTKYEVDVRLNPDAPAQSSVVATIYPASVRTDYFADYKATHEKSPFNSWNEALAKDEKFFNAGKYPSIKFQSTQVKQRADGKLSITGDLTLLGTTKPVTLTAEVVGSVAEHPMRGTGAIGFSATGSFKRSDFGMDYLVSPPILGDEVTLLFEGEFNQVAEPPKASQ